MQSVIYKIQNRLNGNIYVGSSKNIGKRIKRHKRDLKRGVHHNIYLQRAYRKYGEVFEFFILEEVAPDKLLHKEQEWIDALKPKYNIGCVGGGDNITNHPNREDIIKKLTDCLKTAPKPSPRFGEENPNWRGGSSVSYCECGNTKAKSAKVCGKCRIRVGDKNSFYGKTHSEDTRRKIGESRRGIAPANKKKLKADGVIYESATEAAKILGVSVGLITYRVKSNKYDYDYVEV